MNGRGAGCVLHCRLDIEVERFIGNATKSGTPQAGSFFRAPLQPFFFSSSFFSSSSGHDADHIVSPKTFKNQWKINVFNLVVDVKTDLKPPDMAAAVIVTPERGEPAVTISCGTPHRKQNRHKTVRTFRTYDCDGGHVARGRHEPQSRVHFIA